MGDTQMIEIDFDVNQVLQDRLASSMGLDKYKDIMDTVNEVDVSVDDDLQRVFNGFYLVRRNAEEFLETDKARECIAVFDLALPNYSWISDIKKVDAILWSIR